MRVLFVSAGLKARFQQAVLPALASELREQEELQARFKRESAHTARCFKLSGFGHRPQAAGPIRASVRGRAPPARLLLQGTFM